MFAVTAPLSIRLPDGRKAVIAECFPHPRGLLWFELYWDRGRPEETIHLVEGSISGSGPWRVGDCVVNVLGCHGSEPELAAAHARWLADREERGDYPPPPLVAAIARRCGARVDRED